MTDPCIFCRITRGAEPADVAYRGDSVWVFRPLYPVAKGHLLVVPKKHVSDYTTDPFTTGQVMEVAARFGPDPSNLITSAGTAATQTVFHLHVHIVPRAAGDGLHLPWTNQHVPGDEA